jgi:hypothetical protein
MVYEEHVESTNGTRETRRENSPMSSSLTADLVIPILYNDS